jgi:hypothetical protein
MVYGHRFFLWCQLIISTDTKNMLLFFMSAILNDRYEKYVFLVSVV